MKTAPSPRLSVVGHGSKLEAKTESAIAALLSHTSIEAAAKAVGLSANTLLRWMKLPEFKKQYIETRRAVFSQSMARLQDCSESAVTALVEIIKDKKIAVGTRVRAADIVLTHASRSLITEDASHGAPGTAAGKQLGTPSVQERRIKQHP